MIFKNIHQRKKDFLEMCALYIAHICYKHIRYLSFVFRIEKQEVIWCFNSGVSQDVDVTIKFTNRKVYGSIHKINNYEYDLFLNKEHCATNHILLETLAHELRHIWQFIETPHIFTKKKRYNERPHEIDANDFATRVLNDLGIKKCN